MNTKLRYQLAVNFFRFLKKKNLPKKRYFEPEDHSRILIISNTGIGDTMWGTPALSMIRKKYPKSHICVLTSFLSHQVLLNNPHVDEFILIKKGGGLPLFKQFFKLYRKKFDTIIVFHSSYKWMIPFCYLLAPNHLIAFKHDAKIFSELPTELLEAKLNHPIIQRLMLAKRIGVSEEEFQIHIYLKESEKKAADSFFNQLDLNPNKPVIGFQPGASDLFKCWPIQHFANLAKMLYEKLEAQIVIFGSKEEIFLAKEIEKKAPIYLVAGQVPLRVSAALIQKMDTFVTNDTGPLHLAIAQNVPLLTFFGPTPSHLCWPHQESPKMRIFSLPSPCSRCVGKLCKLPYCMERLEVEKAYDFIVDLLEKNRSKTSVLVN